MSQYKVKIKYMQTQLCPVKIYLSDHFPPSFSFSFMPEVCNTHADLTSSGRESAEVKHLDIFAQGGKKISHQLFAWLFLSATQECHKGRNIFKLYQV